jgi:hypothetical protein
MLVFAGVALCNDCSTLAADFHARRELSVPVPERTGWAHGHIDVDALSTADVAALEAEIALVEDLIGPLQRFLQTAQAALAGASRENIAHAAGRHSHRSAIQLPDGTTVVAVSFDADDPYGREHAPDFGLYLDARWDPPWDHAHLDWPDFGLPTNEAAAVSALTAVLGRARAGERVELGCLGGHGRTGTALACLVVLAGHPQADAVAWVRTNYCPDAVETAEQERFVTQLQSDAIP